MSIIERTIIWATVGGYWSHLIFMHMMKGVS